MVDISAFWGKARPTDPMHPLVAHALDVAAVAVLLPRRIPLGIPSNTLGFLVALHDIGKFSRSFQALVPDQWPCSVLGAFPGGDDRPAGLKHDALGFWLLAEKLVGELDCVMPLRAPGRRGWSYADRAVLLRALAGHHGRPPPDLRPPPTGRDVCSACLGAASEFAAAMARLFQPSPLPLPSERDVQALGWQLAGLTTLADWIGSRQAWFPYVAPQAVADPAAYLWGHAVPRAFFAITAAGLTAAKPAPFGGIRGLFPGVSRPTPVQEWAEVVELPPGPILAVIEDLTGSGKTEAAMTLAHRLIADGRAGGVFLALPTMATANAMFGRLADAYRGLFADEARPSLALAHARAALDTRFAAAIDAEPRPPDARRDADPADEPAEAHCAAWLAEDRRRALLAQVGVGTLDQALLAILPVRHAPLRLQGLVGKVLIIDEVHAFDPYMRREMVALLEFHAALGGSVVLLSATLPKAIRQQLADAFQRGLGAGAVPLVRADYPLVTLISAGRATETPCAPREGLPRRVAVTRLEDAAAALDRIVAAEAAGAAVAWVRNTVDDAIAAAAALRARGLAPLLFHARFALADRLAIEAEVLRRFGRDGDAAQRPGVLVATQVIEQSLDLDFDLLVTDLAPVDLLIQRAGRLWRHKRCPRPIPGPELLVVSPEPVAKPAADWIKGPQPGTAAVYRDPALLWRSARGVFGRGAIVTPGDMRPLIEEALAGETPAALAKAADAAQGKDQAAVGMARQNVLDFRKGYAWDAGFWEPETHTPTRLEDRPQVTLRLAFVREGVVLPYAAAADPRRAWTLSEVTVARHRIAACPVPAELEQAAEAARAQWGRWERDSDRMLLAVMMAEGDGYRLTGHGEDGKVANAGYDAHHGLQLDSLPTPGRSFLAETDASV